jgi:nuclear cap-binding protein subunit 1
LTLVKGRSNAEEVIQHAETLRSTLSDSHHEASPDSILRDITIQVLLHVGSRSFSHFLNAIERYLSLLRSITRTSEDRADILVGVAKFWERNWQMVGIVLDKLMQYQIVDPGDIVGWVFARSTATETTRKEGIDDSDWEILTAALDKATGRVAIAKRKVVQVRKEEDDVRSRDKARAAGTEDGSMDVDTETKDGAFYSMFDQAFLFLTFGSCNKPLQIRQR